MKTRCKIIPFIAILLFTNIIAAAQTVDFQDIHDRLDELEQKGLSGNLLIVSDGKEIMRRSFGFRVRQDQAPTTMNTYYYAASLAK